jgi:geranylgeranyl diphosphate synthase type I
MLVHDDIIDEDEERRGKPSSYLTLGPKRALLLGDLLLCAADAAFNLGLSVLTDSLIITVETADGIRDEWITMKRDVLVGQTLDFKLGQTDLTKLSVGELEELDQTACDIAKLKTASYTTIAPYVIGTMIGTSEQIDESSDELKEVVSSGMAFQINNDIDGLEKDLKSGNLSCAIAILYSNSNAEDRKFILKCLDDGEKITPVNLESLRSLFVSLFLAK